MISALAFVCAYGAGIIAAFAVSGAWGFHLYQITYFLNPTSRWWGASIPSIPYSMITVATMGLAWMVHRKKNEDPKITEAPQFKWLLLIGVLMVVVDFYAVNELRHRESMIDFWKLIIVIILAYKLLDNEKKLEMALICYIAGAFYIGWEAYSVGRNSMGRVEGIGMVDVPDANGFAAALVPAVPLLIYFFWKGNNWQRLLSCALGIWIANGIVLINSRGAFLGVSVGCIWFLSTMLLSRHQRGRQRLVAVFIIFASVCAALYVTDELFWERMSTLRSVEDESESGSHRYRMWLSAIELARDYPGGVGAFGFQALSPIYVDADLFFGKQATKAVHSTWFQSLAEIGWLGLGCFLAMIGSCIRSTRRIKATLIAKGDQKGYFRAVAIQSAFFGYLVAGSFIDVFRSQMMFWLMMFTAVQHRLFLVESVSSNESDSQSHKVSVGAVK